MKVRGRLVSKNGGAGGTPRGSVRRELVERVSRGIFCGFEVSRIQRVEEFFLFS